MGKTSSCPLLQHPEPKARLSGACPMALHGEGGNGDGSEPWHCQAGAGLQEVVALSHRPAEVMCCATHSSGHPGWSETGPAAGPQAPHLGHPLSGPLFHHPCPLPGGRAEICVHSCLRSKGEHSAQAAALGGSAGSWAQPLGGTRRDALWPPYFPQVGKGMVQNLMSTNYILPPP